MSAYECNVLHVVCSHVLYCTMYICTCTCTYSWSHRIYSSDFKMEIYLKIARLYLEEQNHISAEAYINRAALLQSEVTNKELHIIYKVKWTRTVEDK